MRVLSYYAYIIGEPITKYHNLLTIEDSEIILNDTLNLLKEVIEKGMEYSQKTTLWESASKLKDRGDDKKKEFEK